MTDDVIDELDACRLAEKEQAVFYRALAAAAEDAGDAALSERLQMLHADEQHHLSRVTARLLELGHPVRDPGDLRPAVPALDDWEPIARRREQGEVARYEKLAARELDTGTAELVRGILEVERAHARELSGKWTPA